MNKPQYWQLLQDPRWQRVRLERLQASNWECEKCGEKNKPLHVHHKVYFKGLAPWEYGGEYLIVLCEDCHDSYHQVADRLKEILALVDPFSAFALLSGFHFNNDCLDRGLIEEGRQTDPLLFAAGLTANFTESICDLGKIYKVADLAVSLTGEDSESRMIFGTSKHVFGQEE